MFRNWQFQITQAFTWYLKASRSPLNSTIFFIWTPYLVYTINSYKVATLSTPRNVSAYYWHWFISVCNFFLKAPSSYTFSMTYAQSLHNPMEFDIHASFFKTHSSCWTIIKKKKQRYVSKKRLQVVIQASGMHDSTARCFARFSQTAVTEGL